MKAVENEHLSLPKVKPGLRKDFLSQRRNFVQTKKNQFMIRGQRIINRLGETLSSHNYQSIMFYHPLAGELSLLPLFRDIMSSSPSKVVLFPRVEGKGRMVAVPVLEERDLVPGYRGIKEPQGKSYTGAVDVIIVPGIAFREVSVGRHRGRSRGLYRLGYGGGYYDRFLVDYPQSFKIGCFFQFQKTDIDFHEPHDIGLDMIITEEEVYHASFV